METQEKRQSARNTEAISRVTTNSGIYQRCRFLLGSRGHYYYNHGRSPTSGGWYQSTCFPDCPWRSEARFSSKSQTSVVACYREMGPRSWFTRKIIRNSNMCQLGEELVTCPFPRPHNGKPIPRLGTSSHKCKCRLHVFLKWPHGIDSAHFSMN